MVQTTYDGRATCDTVASAVTDGDRTGEPRPLTDLVRELRDETSDLVRNEVKLAKIEISEKVSRVTRNSVYIAVGGVLAAASLVVLMLAAAAGVYVALVSVGVFNMTAGWLAPLIVGLVVAAIGYALIHKGIGTIADEGVVPERTVESLRQDKDWIERKVT